MNLKFSESNQFIKTSSGDMLENWIFNIYEQLTCEKPDWDTIRINLGDTEEDELELKKLVEIYEKNPEDAIGLYREIMEEDLQQEAHNFCSIKTAQEEKKYNKEDVKQQIIGGEDLESTDYGPIDSFLTNNVSGVSPDIVSRAIDYAVEAVPELSDKAILSGDGAAYGVVETDLQRKIAKRKILDELDGYPDQMTEAEYENITQRLEEEINKSHAVRININKIQQTMENLLKEVEENVNELGMNQILNDVKIQASIISIGSVIAHEGEHAIEMSGVKGDPRGESAAEETEKQFILNMLQKPEFEYVRPFLRHEDQTISEEERNAIIEKIKIEIQAPQEEQANEDTWYRSDQYV